MGADETERIALRKQTARISLLVGVGMLFLKVFAYLQTNSSAILSDAFESIIHIAATGMAYWSVIVSSRPPDRSHPYGHGKIEFFSAGIEGGLITLAALAIIVEATQSLIAGKSIHDLDIGMSLILGASVANFALGGFLIRRGKQTGSITLVADGKHVLTDAYTSFGVIAGLLLVRFTGIRALDPIVAMIVAGNILVSGYKLVRTSVGGLMDESDHETLRRLVGIIRDRRTPEWISLHLLRVMRSGDYHNIDFHLTIPFYWSIEKGHEFQEEVCRTIDENLKDKTSILVHLDPCTPDYCHLCRINACGERKDDFQWEQNWDVSSLTEGAPVTDHDESR